MDRENHTYQSYLKILEEELVPAMGCTEPIALAYAAARCRDILGTVPEKIVVKASGSIIKNVKSVIVPNTGDHHAKVRITNQHTNIVREEKDGRILFEVPVFAESEEGLRHSYGANIGSVMLKTGSGIQNRAEAMAAAGSDARMNGCEMPVIINSGSGNQGITCSVPVVVYAEDLESEKETLYRALVFQI